MGAWGYGITESDDALDVIDLMEQSPDCGKGIELVEYIRINQHSDFKFIACVVAYQLMTKGEYVEERLRNEAMLEIKLGSIKVALESEGWVDPVKRRTALHKFRDALDDYCKGRKVELNDRGLLDTMFG